MIECIKDFERFKLDSNYVKYMGVLFGLDDDGRVFILELLKKDYPNLYTQFNRSYKRSKQEGEPEIVLINYCSYELYIHISREIESSDKLGELRTSLINVLPLLNPEY